ncbi:MAG: spore coat protein U domain-containing protein [Terracidiphilus sp.]
MKHSCFVKSAMSAALLGFLALGVTPVASASTQTTTFNVTAGVGNVCTVQATNLNFYTIVTTVANSATSTITVNCTLNDVYEVGLGAGDSTVETARFMKGDVTPANHLTYALYNNPGMTVNWGQTTGGQVPGVGSGANQTLTVYGQVPTQTSPGVDNYSDTITVTLTY